MNYLLPSIRITYEVNLFVHQDVSYDIMTDERFAIAIWFALFARVVHLFLRYSTSFILSWIAITLALRIFMYLTMHHCTSANVLTALQHFFHGDLKSLYYNM